MEWYNILMGVIGVLGGGAGLISIYHAKVKKDSMEIENFHSLIEEERREREILRTEYREYKEEVNVKVAEVKKEVEAIKEERNNFLMAIYQGFRCPLPETTEKCPVIKAFKECGLCDACGGGEEKTNQINFM